MKDIKNIIIAVLTVILLIIGIRFCINIFKDDEPNFNYINSQIAKSDELTTAKLRLRGIYNFKDKGTKIISRADFTMIYTATVRIGVELKDVEVTSNEITKKIIVKIPEAKVLEAKVEQNDIEYHDEKFALFNFDSKEDANRAAAEAEKDAKIQAEKSGVIEYAQTEAEAVIKNLIYPAIPKDYKIVIERN